VCVCVVYQRRRATSAAAAAHAWKDNPAVITQNRLTVYLHLLALSSDENNANSRHLHV